MKNQPISLVITVKDEAKTIDALLQSIANQTIKPSEVIIVDGGSSDKTVDKIKKFQSQFKSLGVKLIKKDSNRSMGRNIGIKKSKHDLIAITDAGCILKKNWLQELLNTYYKTKAPVVAGYYHGLTNNPFEQAVAPYFLVMPDRVNPKVFLPATRSMLIEKNLWQTVGGFREDLEVSEDYEFSQRVKQHLTSIGKKIAFTNKAIVSWQPPSTLVDFLAVVLNMSLNDAKAGLVRKKVKLIFVRYFILFLLLSLWLESNQVTFGYWLSILFVGYALWSVIKNVRYAKQGWYWLPVLQITSDVMVMGGTALGLISVRQQIRNKIPTKQ